MCILDIHALKIKLQHAFGWCSSDSASFGWWDLVSVITSVKSCNHLGSVVLKYTAVFFNQTQKFYWMIILNRTTPCFVLINHTVTQPSKDIKALQLFARFLFFYFNNAREAALTSITTKVDTDHENVGRWCPDDTFMSKSQTRFSCLNNRQAPDVWVKMSFRCVHDWTPMFQVSTRVECLEWAYSVIQCVRVCVCLGGGWPLPDPL